MTNRQLADWINTHMDSHSIVDAAILYELPVDIRARIPIYTVAQQRAAIKARGLGGWIADDAGETCNGWEVAEAIASARLGRNPGAQYYGRGGRFRACVSALHSTESAVAS